MSGYSERASARPAVSSTGHMVVAGHPLASLAGNRMLEAGGNAVDAAIAAALATNVVQSELTGLAGIAPTLIYLAGENKVVSILGSGVFPKLATLDYFHRNHAGEIPLGILESMVPGAIDAYFRCLQTYGTMRFADVAAPAIELARNGFPMYPLLARIAREKPMPWPTTREIFFPGGRAVEVGEIFRQPDLAATLDFMVQEEKAASGKGRVAALQAARDSFYKGDIARRIDAFYKAEDGLVRYEDLAEYQGGIHEPLRIGFKGSDVYAAPLNGVHLLEALNILDGLDLVGAGHNSAAYIHMVTEAFKLAFADREAYVGDPSFVDVPFATLLSKDFAAQRRAEIRMDAAFSDMPPAGVVAGGAHGAKEIAGGRDQSAELRLRQDGGTSYLCTMDRHGNAVSMLVSGGNANAPVVTGTGFGLAHFGLCGSTDPNHPNRVEPGKRVRTGGPAMIIRPGKSVMPIGTPGSDVIPQAIIQVMLGMELFGFDPQEAVEKARFASYSFPAIFHPHHYIPGQLKIEKSLAAASGSELARLGHVIEEWPERIWRAASVCAIRKNLETGVMVSGADPRRDAYAIGW